MQVLYVRHNHLSTLDSLPLLINLTELYLDGNRLTSINRLAGAVPALDVLDIRDNRLVRDLSTLGSLALRLVQRY